MKGDNLIAAVREVYPRYSEIIATYLKRVNHLSSTYSKLQYDVFLKIILCLTLAKYIA